MLGIVPTEVSYMNKVTSQNIGSPQITEALRDREEQADMTDSLQSGTVACTLARAKAVQDLISVYENSVVSGDCGAFQSYGGVRASFGRRAVRGSAPKRPNQEIK